MHAQKSWLTLLASVLILVSALALTSRESAIAVVMPVDRIGISAGFLAIALCITWFYRSSTRSRALIFALLASSVSVLSLASQWRQPVCREFLTFSGPVRLAGTSCYPSRGGPFPTAILIHGSGRETRNEYLFYAKFLSRRGIAAVAYDKRGSGRSSGDTYAGTYADYAADAAAVAHWARTQPFARKERIGFVGFSEAEWVAPQEAELFPSAFYVLVGGSGLSPFAQISEKITIQL